MRKKTPLLFGKPDKEYDLDNENHLSQLNIKVNVGTKISDRYSHYPNCKWAVVEFKGSTLRKAIDQLTATVKLLLTAGHGVNFPIIVMKRLSRGEKRTFKRRMDKVLTNPHTGKPYSVRADYRKLDVLLFYGSEVNKMYLGLYKYLWEKKEE